MKTEVVAVWYGVRFPDLKDRRPQSGAPIRVTVRAAGFRNVYLVSPDYDSVIRLASQTTNDQVTVTISSVACCSMHYFEQAGDLAKTLRVNPLDRIPAARELITEESLPLVGAYIRGSVTEFAGSEEMLGGSEPSIYLGEMSRFIYGSETNNTTLKTTLHVTEEIANPALEIGGMEAAAPLKISFNGNVVYEGTHAFVPNKWTAKTFPLPPMPLPAGAYTIEIKNTEKGPVSAVPWFGVSDVRLRHGKE